jgi:hypothetical protein
LKESIAAIGVVDVSSMLRKYYDLMSAKGVVVDTRYTTQ